MRTGKILPWWGGPLAVGGLLLLVLGSLAQGQAPVPLCLPKIHQFRFVMVRRPATGAGPIGDGTVFPGLIFPNGASSGAFFEDLNAQKLKLVIFGPDGVTPATAVWQFFGANPPAQYNYNYKTGVCTKSALSVTQTPGCFAQNATLVESSSYAINFRSDFYVEATSPGHSVEAGLEAGTTSKPLFFLRRDGTNTTQMWFYNLTEVPIDPSQFTPPASCPQ